MAQEALLRRREVERRTGNGRSVIYDLMARNLFPKQVSIGPRAVAWVESEVDAWVAARIAERDHGRDAEGEPPRAA